MRISTLTLVVAVTAGCAPWATRLPPSSDDPVRYVQVRAPSAVDKAMLYVDKLRAMDAERHRAEGERLQRALASGGGDSVRLYHALWLLWSPAAVDRDRVLEALARIQPEAFGEEAPLVTGLVATLRHSLEDGRKRVVGVERRWRQRLREREARFRALEAENRRLQDQINALKAIERSIQQRMNTP